MKVKSICVVRISALGDILMIIPLIRTLQTNIPNISLTWIISKPYYYLVKNIKNIEFIIIKKPKSIIDYLSFKKIMKNKIFDVLLATQTSLRANLLYPFIKAKRKIGFDRVRSKNLHSFFIQETISPGNDHIVDGFLKFADKLQIKKYDIRWDLPISIKDYDLINKYLPKNNNPIILINPSSSKLEKNWSTKNYIELIDKLKKIWKINIILIGGPGRYERILANNIINHVSCIDLVGKTTLNQLLAIIHKSTVLICPDTGPAHMASAIEIPVIALHVVTNSKYSGPYKYRQLVIDHYYDACTILKKRNVRWGSTIHKKNIMNLITVDEVLNKIKKNFVIKPK